MTVQRLIQQRIESEFAPQQLWVENESHMHRTEPGDESHFKLVVVSSRFSGLRLLARHQLVNGVLSDLLDGPVHALALHTYTPEEWLARQGVPKTPSCVSKVGIR